MSEAFSPKTSPMEMSPYSSYTIEIQSCNYLSQGAGVWQGASHRVIVTQIRNSDVNFNGHCVFDSDAA